MQSLLLRPSPSPSFINPRKNPNIFPIDGSSWISTSLKFTPPGPLITSRSSPIQHSSPSPSITTEPTTTAETAPDEKFNWHSRWYPVTLVCELDRGAPRGLTVLGLDVVVWWDRGADSWRVFDNRCPHHLAPLSEGRIDQWGRLQCSYHGWCFGGSGGCKYIPQAPPDGPPVQTFNKARVAVYPSIVQNKILWFWPNTDPKYENILDEEKPPYIAEMDDPSYACQTGMRDFSIGYDFLMQNFLDPAHANYAHYGMMQMPKRPGSSDREGGMPIEINVNTVNADGFIAHNHCQFIAPCVYHFALNPDKYIDGSLYYPGTDDNSQAIVDPKQQRVATTFIIVPVSPGKSRLIWVFQRNFDIWMDGVIPRWILHMINNVLLDSDLCLILQEERSGAEVGLDNWLKACFLPTKSDAQVIAFRIWFRKYCNNRVDFGAKFTGLPPPTPSREQLLDRYHTHVVNCRSCHGMLKVFRALEIILQATPIVVVGILAAAKEKLASTATRTAVIVLALGFFLASKWLAHFIDKTFYFHDWNHSVGSKLLPGLNKLFM